jgi:hypothetical protein
MSEAEQIDDSIDTDAFAEALIVKEARAPMCSCVGLFMRAMLVCLL